ncbi:MAG: heme lyase CcmF/NrfE family subunit [Pseudomonadota bacterium]
MLPELGEFSLVLAACLAILAIGFGLFGQQRAELSRRMVSSLVLGQFVFCLVAFLALVFSFVQDDFSVAYVASHSNSLLPWYYKISATWGGHEGSFLLWTLTMTVWMLAVVVRRDNYPARLYNKVIGVLSLINLGFLAFALLTSNPFTRLIPLTPADGADLNPLLQDFGLIVHPPMLYAGYIGLAVPFAFAMAALLENRVDSVWARWSRPWSNAAWAFLTVGIALGSWWAYYELGWGGWWFWDPSENASFMPWLAATALIHSLAVTEKRGTFKSWTLLLAIAGFSLSLLGGFIIRSGVLTSVHAFAVDPQRGVFILMFLAVVVGSALTLYGLRAGGERAYVGFQLFSREFFMLINNVILVIALAVVLWGTMAPIGYQLADQHISIGPPFFNAFYVPLMLLLAAAVALVPVLNWKRTPSEKITSTIVRTLLPTGLVAFLIWYLTAPDTLVVYAALALALWIVVTHGLDVVRRVRRQTPPLAYWGMTLAHLGFAMSITGVAITSTQSIEEDVRMEAGDIRALGEAQVEFDGIKAVRGPNYEAQQGQFTVTQPDGSSFALYPEKRQYLAGGNVMTEAGIQGGFFADTYISLGEPLPGDAWAVRLHYKPLVRWIWLGALCMAAGALLAVFDARYRRLRRRQSQPAVVPVNPQLKAQPNAQPEGGAV